MARCPQSLLVQGNYSSILVPSTSSYINSFDPMLDILGNVIYFLFWGHHLPEFNPKVLVGRVGIIIAERTPILRILVGSLLYT